MTDTMLIVGDVFVRRDDPRSVFRHVRETMRGADIMIGNLEGAYADSGEPWPKGEIPQWRAGAKQIAAIEEGGFHAMGVTNNHIMDYGLDGLYESLGYLDRLGIKHAGGGRNLAEAHAPALVKSREASVAMLAYTSVFATGWEATPERGGLATMPARTAFEPDVRTFENPGKPPKIRSWMVDAAKRQLKEDIAAARRQAQIVICSFHWGVSSGYTALTEYQVELGHLAVDHGADLVFGHHPHLLQGIEVYKGIPIFYSLGNFTFARHDPRKGHELETVILRCRLDAGKISSFQYVPVRCDDNLDPHILSLADGADIVRLVERRSAAFPTKFRPAGDAMEVVIG
jgi:poly-gamma-glutamate synthesis protein (capsule biosynthesis protein)